MEIKEKYNLNLKTNEIFVKDSNFGDFVRKFTELSCLVEKMRIHLPDNYNFYLVDFIVQNCSPGENTCRDIRWHFDGDYNKENKYVLWVKGPNRTQFSPEVELNPPDSRESQNQYLEKILAHIEPITIPDSTIVAYDSKTPHRGVKCMEAGQRIFVRLLASNYIRPKRIKNAQFS
jgi:hypothetical protein